MPKPIKVPSQICGTRGKSKTKSETISSATYLLSQLLIQDWILFWPDLLLKKGQEDRNHDRGFEGLSEDDEEDGNSEDVTHLEGRQGWIKARKALEFQIPTGFLLPVVLPDGGEILQQQRGGIIGSERWF